MEEQKQGQLAGELNGEEPETAGGKKKKEKEKKPLGQEILSWILTILGAVAAALVIRTLIFEPVRVDGASMNDTLADGEIMFVSKFDYSSTWLSFPWQSDEDKEAAKRFTIGGNPERFDVVICRYPGRGDTNFVKRVAALPGDTVELVSGYLYVNGEKIDEPYVNDDYRTGSLNTYGPFTVPAKGDKLTVQKGESGYTLQMNGTEWDFRIMRNGITVTDEQIEAMYNPAKKMSLTAQGGITYDGTEVTAENAEEIMDSLTEKTFTVDEDYFFVMGDHRNNSNDSRSQGPITRDMIIGHVRTVLFPFNHWRGVE